MREADVHRALEKVTRLLADDDIPYALVGALALGEYGYERVTVDVALLLTSDGLRLFKAKHLGRGYLEKFAGSKGMRDTETGVAIDVLLAGEYPGDGLPKPVVFPDPALVVEHTEGLRLLPLPVLLELKLASGMSAPHRLKDLADVLELIRAAQLPLELNEKLNPWVQAKYQELWQAAQLGNDE
ncbi:MAG TPA: hypothetical protein VI197_04655 [Polyangiaceae bacterium]